MFRNHVLNRLVIALCLVFTSLAIGANVASAVDGDPLTVTYNSGGGSSVAPTSTTVGGTVADPGVPSRSGYTFRGWTLDGTIVTAISVGNAYSCALLGDGTVSCWGLNYSDQVSVPTEITTAKAIAAGASHSCALLANRSVSCWGDNTYGQVYGAVGVATVTAISSGGSYSCALLADRTVSCWGDNSVGQTSVPVGVTTVTAISSGGQHSCALLANRSVSCWGDNTYGQTSVPVGVTTATAISSGGQHSCALLVGGAISCWGDNSVGQTNVPAGITTAYSISSGGSHSCALLAGGAISCWGFNVDGQTSVPAGITTAMAISAGGYHSCALLAGGTLSCWGASGDGQTSVPAAISTVIGSWPYTHGQISDFTLHARWSANRLTITYNPGAGSNVNQSFTRTGGFVWYPGWYPNQSSRPGYTFNGWYTAASAGTKVGYQYAHGRTSDFTLYARWSANTLGVSYSTAGGSSLPAAISRTGGTIANPGVPTRLGYTFDGWYTAASGGTLVTWPYTHGRTSGFTLYARWSAKTLAVSYNTGGGSSVAATSTTTGGTVAEPGVPTRPGYAFIGWYTAVSSGYFFTWPYTHGRTNDFTLYARWSATRLTVSYNTGGGSSVAATSTPVGGTVSNPRVPTRSGYTFDGWYTAASDGSLVSWPYTHARSSDFTLYARWSVKTLAVSYNTGGGSSVIATSTTTGGAVADPGVPSRPGYTFIGWSTAALNGTLVAWPYTHGRTNDFTLYARWR